MMVEHEAEFELWLEAEIINEKANEWNMKIGAADIIVETLEDVLENYRRCKERIEYADDQPVDALTAEQAQVLSLLSIGDMGDEIASTLPVYAEFPTLLSFGHVYVMDDSIDTDWEITDTGRAALKAYQDSHNDE